ncbi:hypothetical protein GCM10023335_91640 [Streptomyces siamensis]|uniref:Uncharacterized protein n=1 Tax=Streptomyces siamensis TaxID=1274986 RepID=A0ABP9JTA3_9ACTN
MSPRSPRTPRTDGPDRPARPVGRASRRRPRARRPGVPASEPHVASGPTAARTVSGGLRPAVTAAAGVPPYHPVPQATEASQSAKETS